MAVVQQAIAPQGEIRVAKPLNLGKVRRAHDLLARDRFG
jgi:hypothetical protein